MIGLETKTALDKYGIKPDVIIGCAGGGSNLGGLIAPFVGEKLRGESDVRIIAVEPASCPSLTRGKYAYDFCDTGCVCPLAKMYTLGSSFIPSANHAGGLRYHGMSSIVSQLYDDGYLGGHKPLSRRRSSRPQSSLRASRASCPRRRAATPSASRSTKRHQVQGDRRGKRTSSSA